MRKFLGSSIPVFSVAAVAIVLWGQAGPTPHNRIPLTEDWSSRHVVFSSPANAERELQIKKQYRYWNQWFRRNARVQMPAADKVSSQFAQPQNRRDGVALSGVFFPGNKDGGGNAFTGSSGVFTAPEALSWWQRPWAVYGIRALCAALFLLALAFGIRETRRRRLAFGLALGLAAGFLALQIGCAGTNNSSTPLSVTPQSLQRDWGSALAAGATVGEGMFPAKFTFDITAAPSCTNDFVVFTTGLSSGAAVTDIVAYNQLYSGTGGLCGAGGPSVLWAYQTTSAGGRTVTSPLLSFDGTQVVYVEGAGGTGVVHILRPGTGANAGTLAAPVTPTPSASAAAYNTCKATPSNVCLFNINFGNAADDSFSPPFYDFDGDILYVGDNGGSLHRFTGIFKGSPAETTAPWPIAVNPTHPLTGPVKDAGSLNVFVNDVDGTLWFVKETGSVTGTCAGGAPPCLGSTSVALSTFPPQAPPRQLITDPPIVDSTTQMVFSFTGHASAFALGGPARGANVFQASTALSGVVETSVGQGDSWTLHTGFFDSAYFASVGTGHLYVCANSATNSGSGSGLDADNHPTLKRIGFNASGVLNSTADAGTLAFTSASSPCSPVTEILNGATDWMFMSVQASGSPAACGGNGCVVSVSVPTGGAFTFPAAVSAALPESGGASGIVVDNVSASGQASSIYFTILANSTVTLTCNGTSGVGCAVKATQSGLN